MGHNARMRKQRAELTAVRERAAACLVIEDVNTGPCIQCGGPHTIQSSVLSDLIKLCDDAECHPDPEVLREILRIVTSSIAEGSRVN